MVIIERAGYIFWQFLLVLRLSFILGKPQEHDSGNGNDSRTAITLSLMYSKYPPAFTQVRLFCCSYDTVFKT